MTVCKIDEKVSKNLYSEITLIGSYVEARRLFFDYVKEEAEKIKEKPEFFKHTIHDVIIARFKKLTIVLDGRVRKLNAPISTILYRDGEFNVARWVKMDFKI